MCGGEEVSNLPPPIQAHKRRRRDGRREEQEKQRKAYTHEPAVAVWQKEYIEYRTCPNPQPIRGWIGMAHREREEGKRPPSPQPHATVSRFKRVR